MRGGGVEGGIEGRGEELREGGIEGKGGGVEGGRK